MQPDFSFRSNPFARLLLFYLTGLILGSQVDAGEWTGIWLPVFLNAALLSVMILLSMYPGFRTHLYSGILAGIMLLLMGLINFSIYRLNGIKVKQDDGFSGVVIIQVSEPVTETAKTMKCISRIRNAYKEEEREFHRQKILTYFEKDSSARTLKPGDRLLCRLKLSRIPEPLNPCEFNYSRYLGTQKVYNQAYIATGSWHRLPDEGISMKGLSYHWQQKILSRYRDTGMDKTLLSLVSAVTLGYKNDLEARTKQAFSKAGVMHVMALSGFNVAVIAFALNYLLFWLSRIRYGNHLKTIIIILAVWLFAFITGLSPSVTRASLMISLVLIGKELNRKLKIGNILYASGFILLTISPALIFDVSFQLSFAAVLGILIFHPPLNGLFQFRNIIATRVWQLFTVSLAAQFATLPLTLYYFHQFPVYFWLTNLYVVPLVSVIICATVVFLLVSFIDPLLLIAGKVLAFLVGLLYKSVVLIELMPFSLIGNLRIGLFQVLLLVLLLLSAAGFIYQRKASWLITTLLMVIVIQVSLLDKSIRSDKQQLLMVGYLRNNTAINLVEGRHSMLITSPLSEKEKTGISYSFGNFWIEHGINDGIQTRHEVLPDGNVKFTFAGYNYLILNSPHIPHNPGCVDVMIVTRNAVLTSELISTINPLLVIMDASVPKYKSEKWQSLLRNYFIDCWSVSKQGAWIHKAKL